MASTRRLAAILAADVAGYSRLMGADEEGTHERLKAHFRELVDPKIEEHRGRIVKNTGDGLLAEFASVVDAVRCAAEIQRGMIGRESDLAEERRIRFRIGVNLGDVIAEQDDIFGDGVNVAARLEALAEPGGIRISRMVRDQIRDKLPYTFEDMGQQSVKNIARPVRVYALCPEAVADLPATSVPSAPPISQPAVAPHLSIVVLPFANLSNDRDQQYFADGITEDLTTDLSRLANMFVISRNTAFTYRNRPVDTKQIGRELGVRYLLEGSLRRSGNRVRVNAQLINTETDAHLWAERFDGDTADIFALQDEVTRRIAVALNLELIAAEATRPTEHPNALDYIFGGRAVSNMPPSRDLRDQAISLFERALELDPRSVEAQTRLAIALTSRVTGEMIDPATSDNTRAEELIEQALAASPRGPLAHFAKGLALRVRGRPEEAILEFETVLAFDRNATGALFQLGWCKVMTGSISEVIPLAEQLISLSPRDPAIANFYWRIGWVHLLQSHEDDALLWLEKARGANPRLSAIRAMLASAYALKSEPERAAAELAEARRLSGDNRYSSMARLLAAGYSGSRGYWGVPKIRALFEATYFAGLRKAGMPEE
jgi:TolB-like protein/class 3 adenylate cyclase/tetratricopeptide (TPR) repeat protein